MKHFPFVLRLLQLLVLTVMFTSCTTIHLKAPSPETEISLYRSNYRECINERKGKKYGEIENIAFPEPVKFQWESSLDGEDILEIAEVKDFSVIERSITAGNTRKAEVYNLKCGTTYYWRIRNGKHTSGTGSFTTAGNVPRIIKMTPPHPVNIRDIGGKRLPDGSRIRQGLVYRGSECNEMATGKTIPPENLAVMRNELKIRTDLDLRYPVQVKGMTASPLGKDVKYIHIPVNAYNSFTPEQNQLFAAAIRVFAKPENYPIYVHCAGGADRTGEIIFLLEQLLGVPREESLVEYETTSLSIYPRPRTIPYFVKWLDSIAAIGGRQNPPAQQVENYLKSIGLTEAEVATIRDTLIGK